MGQLETQAYLTVGMVYVIIPLPMLCTDENILTYL